MFEVLLKAVSDIEKNNETFTGNYSEFQKRFGQYKEDRQKYGFEQKPSNEQLFGRPYNGNEISEEKKC